MSSLITGPVALFQSALRTVDGQLENVALAAEALNRGRSTLPPVTSDFNENEKESFVAKSIEAVRAQVQRGLPIDSEPVAVVRAALDGFASSKKWEEGLDDRKLGLDMAFVFLARAPPSQLTKELEQGAIRLLYRDLPHPPSTHMGPEYQFRSFNGGSNNPTAPTIGRSFTPYSRSCTGTRTLPVQDLPDAGLVYDMLIRRDKFIPHPAGLSGLFFNWATTVIHSVFRTRRTNWNINETSSYVDLGILYGNTKHHCDRLRIVDGQGKIIPDSFAESRISNLPPGVATIMILFNRNHNWIAEKLLAINERGTWKPISKFTDDEKKEERFDHADYKTQLQKQDWEIFQTTRLINSLAYASVVLSDFLAGILGTQRDGSTWTLDIASERREDDHTFLERGQGNSCSVEFNILYRLHPSMSQDDEKFITGQFAYIFGGQSTDELSPELFEFQVGNTGRAALAKLLKREPAEDIYTIEEYRKLPAAKQKYLTDDSAPGEYLWTTRVERFQRDSATGRFRDADLAAALHQATSVPAAAFKARGVPSTMRVIEMLGIEQARNWGACTMNEFRRFLGLRPYATFEEWNPDPQVAEAARKLYRDPENLELYIGLVAEEPKPVGNGAGLCPSFTMARAILADAIALVRGDRHLTFDGTPYNLTAWGFTEGGRDTRNSAFGGWLCRLFNRGLPDYFPGDSVWTNFPLVTPTGQPLSMDNVLSKLGKQKDYTWERPTKQGDTLVLAHPNFVYNTLTDTANGLITPYSKRIKELNLTPSFLSVIDEPAKFDQVTKLLQSLIVPDINTVQLWFHDRTLELVKEKQLSIIDVRNPSHAIDVVKDVFRLVPVHWASTQVAGLPLKTTYQPHGIYYEQQMYQMLKEIYTYVYKDVDPNLIIPLRAEARENVERLARFVKLNLLEAMGGLPANVLGSVSSLFIGNHNAKNNQILKRLFELKSPIDETVNDIIGVISTASVELSQIFAHVVNFYLAPTPPAQLDPDYDAKLAVYNEAVSMQGKLVALATAPTADTPELLAGYVREALRLDPVVDGVWRQATKGNNYGYVKYNKGDKIWFDFRAAGRNPESFAEPLKVDPERPINDYRILQGDTVFKVLGEEFVYGVTANVLRAIFSLPKIRRGKGEAGTLRRFKDTFIAPPDNLLCAFADDPQIRLDDHGEPILLDKETGKQVYVDGKPAPPKPFPARPEDSAFTQWDPATGVPKDKISLYGWKNNRLEDWDQVAAKRKEAEDAGEDPDKYSINTSHHESFLDPEDGHRITPWATGLTLNYDDN